MVNSHPRDESLAALVVPQLDAIQRDVRALTGTLSQQVGELGHVNKAIDRLEATFQETVKELRERDSRQQQAIDGLKLDMSRQDAIITVVSNRVDELESFCDQCDGRKQETGVLDNAHKIEDVYTILGQHNAKMRGISSGLKSIKDEIDEILERFQHIEPWVSGWRWLVLGLGAIFIAALAAAILWALVQSGAGLT